MFLSFISGLFFTLMFFIISLVLVVGVKSIYFAIKISSYKKQPPKEIEKPTEIKKRKPKTVRTIEIDPELADRIYFRKSS